ncbi:MAG: 6-bladed beta-propeller [Candidatus Aminicenantes bacterium]|nr:6-bladed beta-propeller [Candidatus Aminicenantes bacterium]
MRRFLLYFGLISCLLFSSFESAFSSETSQTLSDLFQSGKVNFTRDFVVSEKEFPEEIYFQNPRGIVESKDGRIYITDSSANNIKMISSEGKLIKVIGQEGQGPGDFNSPSFVAISRDRLVVWESMNRRFSILDTPNIHWDITSNGLIVLGCSDLYDIEVHHPDRGRLFTLFHDHTPVKINDADKDNHFSIFTLNIMRGNSKETKQGAPDYIKDNTDFPKYKPAFKEIVTDDEGNIWVRPFHEDRELENHLFDVFDSNGKFIKKIQVFGETSFPSLLTSKIKNKNFWEIEKMDEEYFRIVRNKISE